jgi:Anti-sigma-K factor rskA
MNTSAKLEQLQDLAILAATDGLSKLEATEFAALELEIGNTELRDCEQVASAIALADAPRLAMPQRLKTDILARASVSVATTSVGRTPRFALAGWWAAAASLLLAIAGWWPRLMTQHSTVAAAPVVNPAVDPLAERTAMLAAQSAIRVALKPGPSGGAVLTGDVVFDPVTQRGFLLFRGIPANDPRLARYQLWIADSSRKEPQPVDGGVFDVSATNSVAGDVIIPFNARLPVGAAAAFVITEEAPPGVVVSAQERVVAVGAVL